MSEFKGLLKQWVQHYNNYVEENDKTKKETLKIQLSKVFHNMLSYPKGKMAQSDFDLLNTIEDILS